MIESDIAMSPSALIKFFVTIIYLNKILLNEAFKNKDWGRALLLAGMQSGGQRGEAEHSVVKNELKKETDKWNQRRD